MSEYFSFSVEENEFVIRERENAFEFGGKNKTGYSAYSKKTAWSAARSQSFPVKIVKLDGSENEIGVVFDPAIFEHIVYRGYMSYGVSMTDGYYAPEKFAKWLNDFRRNPQFGDHVDLPGYVRESLPSYIVSLAAMSRRAHVQQKHDAEPSKQRGTWCQVCRGTVAL